MYKAYRFSMMSFGVRYFFPLRNGTADIEPRIMYGDSDDIVRPLVRDSIWVPLESSKSLQRNEVYGNKICDSQFDRKSEDTRGSRQFYTYSLDSPLE